MPRDYLMHQIESFAHVLAKVLSLATLRQYEAAIEIINQTTGKLSGLDLESIIEHSGETLAAHLRAIHAPEDLHHRSIELALLLKQAGRIRGLAGDDEQSMRLYLTGLGLLLAIETEAATAMSHHEIVDTLAGELTGHRLPYETGMRLMEHYERRGRFASAEDILFGLLDNTTSDARLLEAGTRFYERLQLQEDVSLVAGNLPREELQAGLAQLRARSL